MDRPLGQFATSAEATEAGYRAPKWQGLAGLFPPAKDLHLRVVDTSGPHAQGYAFALKVFSAHDLYAPGAAEDHRQAFAAVEGRVLAVTETLWLKDAPNQLGQPGSFVVRYSPQALEQAQRAWAQVQCDYAEALAVAREAMRPKTLEESIRLAVEHYQAYGLEGEAVCCEHDGRQLKIWCNLALPAGDQVSISAVEGPVQRVVTGEFAEVIQQVLHDCLPEPELPLDGLGI